MAVQDTVTGLSSTAWTVPDVCQTSEQNWCVTINEPLQDSVYQTWISLISSVFIDHLISFLHFLNVVWLLHYSSVNTISLYGSLQWGGKKVLLTVHVYLYTVHHTGSSSIPLRLTLILSLLLYSDIRQGECVCCEGCCVVHRDTSHVITCYDVSSTVVSPRDTCLWEEGVNQTVGSWWNIHKNSRNNRAC